MNVRFGRPEHLNIRCKRRQVHSSSEIETDLMLACGARLGSSVLHPARKDFGMIFGVPRASRAQILASRPALGLGQKQFRLKDRC